jgi:hypothetical protein
VIRDDRRVWISNYDSLTELHPPKITVTTAYIKPNMFSLAVAWQRLLTADVRLLLCSRNVPGLRYQLLISQNCSSQLTQPTVIRVRVRVTLRLAVYRRSVRLGAKPLEAHDQRFFFCN